MGKNEKDGRGFCREWDVTQPGSPKDYLSSSGYVQVGATILVLQCRTASIFAIACGEEGGDRAYACVFNVADPATAAGIVLEPSSSRQPALVQSRWQEARHGQRGWNGQGLAAPGGTDRECGDDAHPRQFGLLGRVQPGQSLRRHREPGPSARVWDAETGDPVSPPLQHSGSVDYAKFTSDGRQVVTHSPDMLHVWDRRVGARNRRSSSRAPRASIRFAAIRKRSGSPAGRIPAAGVPKDGLASGTGGPASELTPELPHPGRVTRLALSPHGGPFLATACDDSSLRVWRLASGSRLAPRRSPTAIQQLRFVTFSPDGAWLVVAGADRAARHGVARVYSVSAEGKLTLEKLTVRHDAPINIVVFNPRGDRFVTLTGDTAAEPGRRRSGIGRELAPS